MAFTVGQMVGPYKITAQLGAGGMATIYKAYHERLDRYVAIKVMHPIFLEDATFLSRFEREARIVARLDHPHIVPIYDFAELDNQPYLVMKFIEGKTLKSINEAGSLSLEAILRLLPPIADALDYAHRNGVLHRDVKPSNILLDKADVPYITDFGLARMAAMGDSTLSADMLLGTPHYISPEQAQGKRELSASTDIYSFGVVAYELLVGRVPFHADTPFAVIHDHIYRPLPPATSLNPDLPPSVERVLDKVLAKSPETRYATATSFVNALKAAIAEASMTTLNPNRAQVAKDNDERLAIEDAIAVASDGIAPAVAAYDPFADENIVVHDGETTALPQTAAPPSTSMPRRRVVDDVAEAVEPEKPKRDSGNPPSSRPFDWQGAWNGVQQGFEDVVDQFSDRDEEIAPPDDERAMRKRIEKRFAKRNEFVGHLTAFGIVNLILWVVYITSNNFIGNVVGDAFVTQLLDSFPFPLIVFFGWGAGLFAHAVDTYYQTGERAVQRTRLIQDALYQEYGADWSDVPKKELRRVRRRVDKPLEKRKEFFSHLGVYAMINIMLWTIWLFSSDILAAVTGGDFPAFFNEFPWPLFPMLGWGIGLVFHALETLGTGRQNTAVDRAMARERERMGNAPYEKPKRDRMVPENGRVRLNEDGELTDSFIRQYTEDEDANQGRRRR